VVARLSEGWTPEQICGRLAKGIEIDLGSISTEAIYAWIYSKARKADRLWRTLTRGRPRRGWRKRASKDHIGEKTHISERSEAANQREELGHWEADLVICKRSRPVLVLHERKTRLTLISRLMGKTAAETVSALIAMVKRLSPALRGSIAFDNGGEFARHALLRDMLSATTYFCDAYASLHKGGVENTNGRIRRWLPRSIDLDQVSDEDIQEIAMTLNSTPRKCLGFKTPIEAILAELGKDVQIRFA
jgi:IS30 family transposase